MTLKDDELQLHTTPQQSPELVIDAVDVDHFSLRGVTSSSPVLVPALPEGPVLVSALVRPLVRVPVSTSNGFLASLPNPPPLPCITTHALMYVDDDETVCFV